MTAHTDVKVSICESPTDAIRQGFVYREPVFKGIKIDRIVLVKGGTESGNPTIDFILEDGKGQKYTCMITAGLLQAILDMGN